MWASATALAGAALALALAGCSSTSPAVAPPATTGATTTSPAATAGSSTTVAAAVRFPAISATYLAGTADGGSLYVRSDGASRFSAPDTVSCPNCSTASAPEAHLDFSLTTLEPVAGGGYIGSGTIMAESDPAWAAALGPAGAGPVGATVSLTVSSGGNLSLSFLASNDVLTKSAGT
jgi:hypothetical protein